MRSSPSFSARRFGLIALLAASAATSGCARNSIELIDLDFRRLPDKGFSERVRVPQCYWWADGERLNIAASGGWAGLKPATRERGVDLSFALEGLPAEDARYYTLDTESLRAYVHNAPQHLRYRSLQGIAAVWLKPGGGLRVKFRVAAQKESFSIFTGWSALGQTVLVGELVGREDAERGGLILARSEKDDMGRLKAGQEAGDTRPRPVQVTGPAVQPRSQSDK